MLTRGDDRGDDECRHRRDATEAERENRQVSHPARAVGAAGLISQNSNEAHRQQPTRGNQRREKSGIKNRCDHTACVPKFGHFMQPQVGQLVLPILRALRIEFPCRWRLAFFMHERSGARDHVRS